MLPKTNVYIDGFNLYYAIRKTPYKWLDLGAVFRQLLPDYDIARLRYFTARIKARPNDPFGPDRQDAYLRALATVPGLSIHYGQFLASRRICAWWSLPRRRIGRPFGCTRWKKRART